MADFYRETIRSCVSLPDVMKNHKAMMDYPIFDEVALENIGPDKYGMFRTDNIENMSMSEVYLGGEDGLNTYSAEWWEARKDENPEAYATVVNQYKSHLLSNIESGFAAKWNSGVNIQALARYISRRFEEGRPVTIVFPKGQVQPNRLNELEIRFADRSSVRTDLLVISPDKEQPRKNTLLLPKNFLLGERVTAKNIKALNYLDLKTSKVRSLDTLGLFEKMQMSRH